MVDVLFVFELISSTDKIFFEDVSNVQTFNGIQLIMIPKMCKSRRGVFLYQMKIAG